MGTFTLNGKTYETIEMTAPQMTKEQAEWYTLQVGQFGSPETAKKSAKKRKRNKK